jgi:AcrR family transcriptional regulator
MFLIKKKDCIKHVAIQLIAQQGFDATTTLEIAMAANVTEPVVYYHFKNKDGLFTAIIVDIFKEYFNRLESINLKPIKQFDYIENLINFHFEFVDEFPNETYLITSACPAKLRESAHICAREIEAQKTYLAKYISDALNKGIDSGEFYTIHIDATASLLLAMINGLLRRRSLKLDNVKGLKEEVVEFCRRSLVKEF